MSTPTNNDIMIREITQGIDRLTIKKESFLYFLFIRDVEWYLIDKYKNEGLEETADRLKQRQDESEKYWYQIVGNKEKIAMILAELIKERSNIESGLRIETIYMCSEYLIIETNQKIEKTEIEIGWKIKDKEGKEIEDKEYKVGKILIEPLINNKDQRNECDDKREHIKSQLNGYKAGGIVPLRCNNGKLEAIRVKDLSEEFEIGFGGGPKYTLDKTIDDTAIRETYEESFGYVERDKSACLQESNLVYKNENDDKGKLVIFYIKADWNIENINCLKEDCGGSYKDGEYINMQKFPIESSGIEWFELYNPENWENYDAWSSNHYISTLKLLVSTKYLDKLKEKFGFIPTNSQLCSLKAYVNSESSRNTGNSNSSGNSKNVRSNNNTNKRNEDCREQHIAKARGSNNARSRSNEDNFWRSYKNKGDSSNKETGRWSNLEYQFKN